MFVLLSAATPSRLLTAFPPGVRVLRVPLRRGDRAGAFAAFHRDAGFGHAEPERMADEGNEDTDAAAPREIGLGRSRRARFRPAAERAGRRAARAMGREMRALGLGFDRVLASPARRVAETIPAVAASFGPLAAEYDERLYLARSTSSSTSSAKTDDGHANACSWSATIRGGAPRFVPVGAAAR